MRQDETNYCLLTLGTLVRSHSYSNQVVQLYKYLLLQHTSADPRPGILKLKSDRVDIKGSVWGA